MVNIITNPVPMSVDLCENTSLVCIILYILQAKNIRERRLPRKADDQFFLIIKESVQEARKFIHYYEHTSVILKI